MAMLNNQRVDIVDIQLLMKETPHKLRVTFFQESPQTSAKKSRPNPFWGNTTWCNFSTLW